MTQQELDKIVERHTHDNFKIAGKIIDQVSALKQYNENPVVFRLFVWELAPAAFILQCGEFGFQLGIALLGEHTRTLDAYDTDKGKFKTYRPTAWMPLPKAPEEADK